MTQIINKVDGRLIYDIQYMKRILESALGKGQEAKDADRIKCFDQLLESLFHIEVIVTQHLDKSNVLHNSK